MSKWTKKDKQEYEKAWKNYLKERAKVEHVNLHAFLKLRKATKN